MVIRRVAARDESMAKTARAVQWQVDHFTEIPVLVVACLRLGARDGRLPFVRMPHAAESGYWGSIYPSVQNLLLAARAMGLGASLITLPLWSVTSARRTLNLPLTVTPCCIVPLGWPRGRYGPTTRKPVDAGDAPRCVRQPRLARRESSGLLDDSAAAARNGSDHGTTRDTTRLDRNAPSVTAVLEVIDKGCVSESHPVPLLFVHGAWHAAWCWDEYFLSFFADKGYRALAVSLRGHGSSPTPKPLRTCSVADYVEDVSTVADSLPTRPVVIGHSMGGVVVQKYLESHDAPAGVLMASTPPQGYLGSGLRWMKRHPWHFAKIVITGKSLAYVNTPQLARERFFYRTDAGVPRLGLRDAAPRRERTRRLRRSAQPAPA